MERLARSITAWATRVRMLDGRDVAIALIVLLVPGASLPWLLSLAWQRFRPARDDVPADASEPRRAGPRGTVLVTAHAPPGLPAAGWTR